MRKIYKHCTLLILITIIVNVSPAQEKLPGDENKREYIQSYLGIGVGFDYGGIGLKAEFLPVKSLGIFCGAGYNLVEPAFNAGLSFKVWPHKKVTPTLMAMYGYNAVIKLTGVFANTISENTYYGLSMGTGVEIKYGDNNNKLCIALMVPFRNSGFHNDYNNLKNTGYDFNPGILPVAFSVGANFAVNRKKKK